MPRTNLKRMANKLADKICRSYPDTMMIPHGDIKFLRRNPNGPSQIFGIRSPLTHTWQEFEIDDRHVVNNLVPADIENFTKYYHDMTMILEQARYYSTRDIKPIDEDEAKIFGFSTYYLESIKGRVWT